MATKPGDGILLDEITTANHPETNNISAAPAKPAPATTHYTIMADSDSMATPRESGTDDVPPTPPPSSASTSLSPTPIAPRRPVSVVSAAHIMQPQSVSSETLLASSSPPSAPPDLVPVPQLGESALDRRSPQPGQEPPPQPHEDSVSVIQWHASFFTNRPSTYVFFGFFIAIIVGLLVFQFVNFGNMDEAKAKNVSHKSSVSNFTALFGGHDHNASAAPQTILRRRKRIAFLQSSRPNLDDLLSERFTPQPPNGTWHGSSWLYRNSAGDLVALNARDNRTSIVLPASHVELAGIQVRSHQMSADGRFVLLELPHQLRFRHSRRSFYRLIALDRSVSFEACTLSARGADVPIDYARFGPVGSQLAIVQAGNVYVYPDADYAASADIQPQQAHQFLGSVPPAAGAFHTGISDWMYEEEMFFGSERQPAALWFSPDGKRLAYATFDETAVAHTTQDYCYGDAAACERRNGGAWRPTIRYPRAADKMMPRVRISVVRLRKSLTARDPRGGQAKEDGDGKPDGQPQVAVAGIREMQLLPMMDVDGGAVVLATADWTDDMVFVSVWMNREQTRAYVQSCRMWMRHGDNDAECQLLIDFHEPHGWLNMGGPLFGETLLNSNIAFTRPHRFATGDPLLNTIFVYPIVHRHIHAPNVSEPNIVGDSRRLHVERIVHMDKRMNVIFYLASQPDQANAHQLYAVHARLDRVGHCLTCALGYSHFRAHFSRTAPFVLLESLGPQLPRHDIYEWSIDYEGSSFDFRRRVEMQTNGALAERLRQHEIVLPTVRYVRLENVPHARVRLLSVHELEPGARAPQKLALVVLPGGGPDTFVGTDEWRLDWATLMAMATQPGTVVAQVDARGSGRQPMDRVHAVHGRLGRLEADDVRAVARGLLQRYASALDRERVGIWGAGYAGYVAGMSVGTEERRAVRSTFRCAAMVAPITDWTEYNALYANRYMGRWNEEAYRNASLLENLEGFKRHDDDDLQVLLVHDHTGGEKSVQARMSAALMERLTEMLTPENLDTMVYAIGDKKSCRNWEPMSYMRTVTEFMSKCLNV